MFRRVVSLTLVPCLLLTQSAALGHAHGGDEPAGHDARPHLHTAPTSDDHHHHHGPGGHSHHHDADDAEPEPRSPDSPPSQPEHDADAVFVAAGDAVLAGRSQAVDETPPSILTWWLAAGVGPFAACSNRSAGRSAAHCHPPPPCSPCPLYVRHLALLI
jgi:hypothetical protein